MRGFSMTLMRTSCQHFSAVCLSKNDLSDEQDLGVLRMHDKIFVQVFTNVRCTHECWKSLSAGYDVAIRGGCVMGLSLVSVGVLALYLLIKLYTLESDPFGFGGNVSELYDAIAGFGLGGSSIALFGRVGGGIYTKAADVGADLSGKIFFRYADVLFGDFLGSGEWEGSRQGLFAGVNNVNVVVPNKFKIQTHRLNLPRQERLRSRRGRSAQPGLHR